jgi:hypothetical protein
VTPITILDYNTRVINGNDVINVVRTSQEQNSRDFILERSANAVNFDQVGPTLLAAGNSNDVRSYTITDNDVPAGIRYYRFKETDIDGKTTYTKVNKVQINNTNKISLSPNPTSDMLNIM